MLTSRELSRPWQEIGDRVFVRRYELFDQTIGVVIGAEGVVVIDTRASHRRADELIGDLRELTRLPIAFVVNTHMHFDHTFGNARFRPAPVWGHVRCAAGMREGGEAKRRQVMERLPELADELAEVEIVPPDQVFSDSAVLDLGDRQLELRFLGRGHTDNDLVVLVPDARVLFAGDLLENGAPPSFGDAFPLAWAETGVRLLDLVEGAVAPGHGEVADRRFAAQQVGALAALADLCRASVAGQIGVDEAVRRSPFPADTTRVALDRAMREIEESRSSG
ncbi:MAG: MBL fold metallo-hydrolase [Chloroflexota bacterium]|nr:MBL fold metallo-hydrolase [Chloroflexota bacterium]